MLDSIMEIEHSVQAKVKELFSKGTPTIHDSLGIVFTKLSKNHVSATMPVDHRTHQPFGLMHGGASLVLAESCASIGSWLNIDEVTQAAVGVEVNGNHIRAATSGTVTGVATPLRIGKTLHVWQIEITDESKQVICVSRCTLSILNKK